MSEPVLIEVSDTVLRDVDAVARRLGQSREAWMLHLVADAAAREQAFVAAVEAGLAELDRGESISQEEMERIAESFAVPA